VGGEQAESLLPEGGNDVVVGDALVIARGIDGHLVAKNVLVPASEQIANCQCPVGSRESVVKLALQHLELANYLNSRLGRDISTDWLAGAVDANQKDPEPQPVGSSLVNGPFTVAALPCHRTPETSQAAVALLSRCVPALCKDSPPSPHFARALPALLLKLLLKFASVSTEIATILAVQSGIF
jgi:hypothetical protein